VVLARQNVAATQYDDLASKQQGLDEDVLSISATQAEHARTMDGIDSHHANLKSTIQRVERSQREMNGDLNVLNDESGVLKKTLDDIDLNSKNLRRADGILTEVQSKVNTTLSDLQVDLDRDTAVANTLKEDSRVLEERRADQAEAQVPREARIKDYESLVQKNGEKLAAVDSGFKVVSESASQHGGHLNELLHGIDNLRSDQLMANATLHAVSRLETAQDKTLDLLYNVQNKTHRELMTAHHTMEGLSAMESAIETDMPAQMSSVAAAQRVQAGLKEAMVAMRDAVSSDTTNAKGLQDKVKTVRKQVEELVEGQRSIDNVITKAQDTQNGLNVPMKGSATAVSIATTIAAFVALSIM
jgi:chromosome segregation ATPase